MPSQVSTPLTAVFDQALLQGLQSTPTVRHDAISQTEWTGGQVVPVFDWSFFNGLHGDTRLGSAAAAQAYAPARVGPPVLVVEDDLAVREVLCEALTEQGLNVESASDGQEALDCLAHRQPALVLLDMHLPRVDGEAVAAGIRRRYAGEVPIVAISAYEPTEEVERVRPSAYLSKPFRLDDLVSTVQRVLDHTPR